MPGTLLHRSGPLPLAIRIPALLIGLVALTLTVAVAGRALVPGLFPPIPTPSGTLVGILGGAALALFMLNLWWATSEVWWHPASTALIQRGRMLGFWRTRAVPIDGCAGIVVRCGRVMTTTQWTVLLRPTRGADRWLAVVDRDDEAERLAAAIAAATGLPVLSA